MAVTAPHTDTLQENVFDAMNKYVTKNIHGKNTRNEELSVKLLLMRTEFGRKGLYFLAAKAFNSLPIQVRKVEFRLFSFFVIVKIMQAGP